MTDNTNTHKLTVKRWSMPWVEFVVGLVVIVGLVLVLYSPAASWFSARNQANVINANANLMEAPPHNDQGYRDSALAAARQYNQELVTGALYRAGDTKVYSESGATDTTYDDLLNMDGTGFMARLGYEALDIDLPVYHGASDETLSQGVGHLQGTSLPVGGIGTRSVLTAHRGLPEATLFTNLNDAAINDAITISVMGEVLVYVVTDIRVIQPDQTESILPDEALWVCWRLSSFDFYQFLGAGNPSIERFLELRWGHITEVAMESFRVVPVHPP